MVRELTMELLSPCSLISTKKRTALKFLAYCSIVIFTKMWQEKFVPNIISVFTFKLSKGSSPIFNQSTNIILQSIQKHHSWIKSHCAESQYYRMIIILFSRCTVCLHCLVLIPTRRDWCVLDVESRKCSHTSCDSFPTITAEEYITPECSAGGDLSQQKKWCMVFKHFLSSITNKNGCGCHVWNVLHSQRRSLIKEGMSLEKQYRLLDLGVHFYKLKVWMTTFHFVTPSTLHTENIE